jgi:transcriptional regulator with XRE-family HTH domain
MRKASGVSKSALSKAFKYESLSQVNKWLNGKAMPQLETLNTLADALGVARAVMYTRAGHPHRVVVSLPRLYSLGQAQADRDGLRLDPLLGGTKKKDIKTLPDASVNEYRWLTFYDAQGKLSDVFVPMPIYDAMLFAIGSFPRRGDYYSGFAISFDLQYVARMGAALDADGFDFGNPRSVPVCLKKAADILSGRNLPPDTRRAMAGELTRVWAVEKAPVLAELVARTVYAVYADQYGTSLIQRGHLPGMALSELLTEIKQLELIGISAEFAQKDVG